jgi:hypothetical protein
MHGSLKKKTDAPTCLFFEMFWVFQVRFQKYFYGVFELVMQTNGKKTR